MNINTAYFAGGCFWCMTKPFDQFDGIETVTSGYMVVQLTTLLMKM